MSMQEIIRTFADKMYKYRKEVGLTQEELAEMLDLDNSYVSLLERGARVPSIITLGRIAKVFGVKPYDLLVVTPDDDKYGFRQRELLYLIAEAPPEKIDKIFRIMKVLGEPTGKRKGK